MLNNSHKGGIKVSITSIQNSLKRKKGELMKLKTDRAKELAKANDKEKKSKMLRTQSLELKI